MPKLINRVAILALAFVALGTVGCRGPEGETVGQKKQHLRDFAEETIAMVTASNPQVKEELENSAGYAVFSSMNTYLFTFSSTNGFGIATNKESGKEVFMKVFGLGFGVGMGVKIFRELLIFENAATAKTFLTSGFEFSGKAEGVAKVGNEALVDETINQDIAPGIKSYVITDTGLIGQASVHGKKYYKFDALENSKDEDTFDMSEEEGGETKN